MTEYGLQRKFLVLSRGLECSSMLCFFHFFFQDNAIFEVLQANLETNYEIEQIYGL